MDFGRIATRDAEGAILAHSVRTNSGAFKKGRVLSAADVAALTDAGIEAVVAARLGPGDVPEDEAASRIANAACGPGCRAAAAFTGRCNLTAETRGLALIDEDRLDRINLIDESVTVATVPPFEPVEERALLATVKIIPFAAPADVVAKAERQAADGGPLVRIARFAAKTVGLVMTELPGTKASVLGNTARNLADRLAQVDARLLAERRVPHDEAEIGRAVGAFLEAGCDMVVVSGASAVVDRRDVVPQGIVAAGGVVDHFGMPVDPGNLLLLGHAERGGRRVPVLGMPGCARSPKLNGFDWVLQRLAADVEVSARDVMRMGAGGLLKEISTRPQPRERPPAEPRPKAMPKVAAVILAAGQSRRMGRTNKLLADVDGLPMVRRVAENVLATSARPVIVVTGHQADKVKAALDGLDLRLVHNPDYAEGLSTSLRAGLEALPPAVDGALVCLADMPLVGARHLERLFAAFDPLEGRAICVPVRHGKRGNPVLWAAPFFAQMMQVAGDVGARHLIGENAEVVCEVEMADDGTLADIDTPAALAALTRPKSA
jgi:molybdenum cofactor cytidylyltransferase